MEITTKAAANITLGTRLIVDGNIFIVKGITQAANHIIFISSRGNDLIVGITSTVEVLS